MGSKKVRQYWLYSVTKARYSSASSADTCATGASMFGVRRSACPWCEQTPVVASAESA